ncbi:hypothetical protein QE152_g40019 [Popillia japonica]|uniref:Uncharacterized protein n=1 Tax=Popillia japonica TaxID=7064 RepID=A0AAW1HSJ1_POPJA
MQVSFPTTIEDALNGDDSVQWKRAIEDELQSFEENQAWVLADLPEGATCVQNKWVFKKKWKRAIEDELQSFEENQAWVLADLPEGATCVQNKWVFKKKVDSAGGVKFRARLVAKGKCRLIF